MRWVSGLIALIKYQDFYGGCTDKFNGGCPYELIMTDSLPVGGQVIIQGVPSTATVRSVIELAFSECRVFLYG